MIAVAEVDVQVVGLETPQRGVRALDDVLAAQAPVIDVVTHRPELKAYPVE